MSSKTSIMIFSLPWRRLMFGNKIFSSEGDRRCHLRWQSGTSTLFLSSHTLGTIDLHVDEELLWMEV